MEEEHSKLWRLALIISLAAFVAVAYLRIPPFRALVNEKYPWIKAQLVERGIKIVDDPSEAQAEPTPEAQQTHQATPAPAASINLDQIAADRSLWPKDVILKKPIVFPAVVDGKEVGKVTVAAGTAVQLYRIEHQKLALVYNGGGAWVQPAETDLAERLHAPQPPR